MATSMGPMSIADAPQRPNTTRLERPFSNAAPMGIWLNIQMAMGIGMESYPRAKNVKTEKTKMRNNNSFNYSKKEEN